MFIKSIKIFLSFMILFFIFSLQYTYVFTDNIGLKTMSGNVPSLRGIATHSFIFSIVLCILMMTLFNSKKEKDENEKKYLKIRRRVKNKIII
jgi:hypothetical protein